MRSVLKFWQKITEQGLSERRGSFLNFLGLRWIYNAKSAYIAVNACLGWLNYINDIVKEQNIIYMET